MSFRTGRRGVATVWASFRLCKITQFDVDFILKLPETVEKARYGTSMAILGGKKLLCQGAVAVGGNMFYNIIFKNFLLKNLVVSAEVPTFALAFGKEPRQAEGQRS